MRVDSIKRDNAGATRGGQLEEGAAVGEGARQVPLPNPTGKEAQKQGRLRNCMQQYAHTFDNSIKLLVFPESLCKWRLEAG